MTEIIRVLQERAEMLETTQWSIEFKWNEIESIAKYLYISLAAKWSTIFNEGSRNAEMYLNCGGQCYGGQKRRVQPRKSAISYHKRRC